MSVHQLIDILISYGPLPKILLDKSFLEELKAYLKPLITSSFYTKRQLLLSAGQIANAIYFVEKGLVRGFYTHFETEKTCFLWNEKSIVTIPESFYHRVPSQISIEVMPSTRLMGIYHHHLTECINEHPVVEVFSRNIVLQYSAYHAKRNHDLTFLSAWERYLQLLHTHPDIEQQVSKEIIASYLNLTPQSLSRLLKEKGHP